MTSVLHWWPIGVRKSQAAPIATAIRNASAVYPRSLANVAAIGAMTRTVAALFKNGVTSIATVMISASAPYGGSPLDAAASQPAATFAAPVVWIDSLTGISAPS